MVAMDYRNRAMVGTTDGENWKLIASENITSIENRVVKPVVIPGNTPKELGIISIDNSNKWAGMYKFQSLNLKY